MKKTVIIVLAIFQVLCLTSCLTTKETNLLREPGGGIPSYPQVEAIGEYTIKHGDELSVSIIVPEGPGSEATSSLYSLFSNVATGGEGQRIRTLTVSPEGVIYFPYLGNIYVVGKTTLEVQRELERRLNKEIIVRNENCQVYVRLATRYFSVIGESGVGRYSIPKEQLTIFQALSQSGDVKGFGNRAKVRVIRQTETGTLIKEFDLRSKKIINSEFYYIQPNDVIYVEALGREFLGISSFSTLFGVIASVSAVTLAIINISK